MPQRGKVPADEHFDLTPPGGLNEFESGRQMVNHTALESYIIPTMVLRSLIIAMVFVLGGLHGGPSVAAQGPGHEDNCLEYRHEAHRASRGRKVSTTNTFSFSFSHIEPAALALAAPVAVPAQSGQDRGTLLSLRCLFLI